MKSLPASPDLSHLKKQAKELLHDARAADLSALKRFLESLPALRGSTTSPQADKLQLHDAQSVIAREYGFPSWLALKQFVEWKRSDRNERIRRWLEWVYEGGPRELTWATRTLQNEPDLFTTNEWFACSTGDESTLRSTIANDPLWVNGVVGPLRMPPLVAATHSLLILKPEFEQGLLHSARLLLENGADVNVSWTNPKWPEWPLSALYGAAGRTHHAGMLRLLLEAGADPDDNESLYHSVESSDSSCTRMLLNAGARVAGTNAIGRVLDYGKLDDLERMLERGEAAAECPWIHHAILRGRSIEFIRVLVAAGADLRAVNNQGISLYRWAELHGRTDVLELLGNAGVAEELTDEDQFVAACARADEATVRTFCTRIPDIFSRLTKEQLRALPEQADIGNIGAVRTMLDAGWPREVKAGWKATALNLAVYRGDAAIAELLLAKGASWETKHGFGDNVLGTLSYASQSEVEDPSAPRDYLGCARVLVAHRVPLPDGRYTFSPAVTDYFDSLRLRAPEG